MNKVLYRFQDQQVYHIEQLECFDDDFKSKLMREEEKRMKKLIVFADVAVNQYFNINDYECANMKTIKNERVKKNSLRFIINNIYLEHFNMKPSIDIIT